MNQALATRTQSQLRNAEAALSWVSRCLTRILASTARRNFDVSRKIESKRGNFQRRHQNQQVGLPISGDSRWRVFSVATRDFARMLIAGSILIGRALQPVEQAVGAWSGFVAAKGQYERLNQLMNNADANPNRMAMPEISGALAAKGPP